jgi:hypothetical protein
MSRKFFIEIEEKDGINLYPLKKWIKNNYHQIQGYVFNETDITHKVESKLIDLGFKSIYDELNNYQVLTKRSNSFQSKNNDSINSKSLKIIQVKKHDLSLPIGKIVVENGILNKEKFVLHKQDLSKSFDIEWLKTYSELCDSIESFVLDKNLFNEKGMYNQFVTENILINKLGCYIFSNILNSEVLYVGMAGKIKTNGSFSQHSIEKRLKATRTKDTITKKDISTEDYLKYLFQVLELNELKISVLYTKPTIPSGYLEALLLFDFYKKYSVLPLLNNAF